MTMITSDTSESEAVRVGFDRNAMALRTAIPCVVIAVGPRGEWVDVQPAVSLTQRLDEETRELPLPILRRVPVSHPGSSSLGLFVSVPIKAGDDGELIVQDRAIDAWQDGSGVGRAPDMATPRHHDLTDSIFVPGLMRASGGFDDYNPEAVELRTVDGSCRLTVDATTITAIVPGGAQMVMDGAQTMFTGNVLVDGNLGTTGAGGAPGDITINGALAVQGSLNVAGAGTFGGPVTAPAFNEG